MVIGETQQDVQLESGITKHVVLYENLGVVVIEHDKDIIKKVSREKNHNQSYAFDPVK